MIEHLYRQGTRLRTGAEEAIKRRGLESHVKILGRPCCLLYATLDRNGKPSQAYRSLFLQETIKRGVIMPSLVLSYSHTAPTSTPLSRPSMGPRSTRALEDGAERYLVGRPSQIVYRRLTNQKRWRDLTRWAGGVALGSTHAKLTHTLYARRLASRRRLDG